MHCFSVAALCFLACTQLFRAADLNVHLQKLQGSLALLEQQIERNDFRGESEQLKSIKVFFQKCLNDYEEKKIFSVNVLLEVQKQMKSATADEKKRIINAYADFLLTAINVVRKNLEASQRINACMVPPLETLTIEPLALLGESIASVVRKKNSIEDWAWHFKGMNILQDQVENSRIERIAGGFLDILLQRINFIAQCMLTWAHDDIRLSAYVNAQEELMKLIGMLQKNGGIYHEIANVLFNKIFKNITIFEREPANPNNYPYMLDMFRKKYANIAHTLGIDILSAPTIQQMTTMLLRGTKDKSLADLISALKKVVNINQYGLNPKAYEDLHTDDAKKEPLKDIIEAEEKFLGAIERRFDRVIDNVAKKSKGYLSACSSAPQGIDNSTGTCFINADLQVWRAIYCVPEGQAALNVALFGAKEVRTENAQFKPVLAQDVTDFLNAYGKESPRLLENRILKIQADLESIDSRLEVEKKGVQERMLSGRTHVVMNILCDSITFYPSNIYANRDHFKSSIGFIGNDVEIKKDFNRTWTTGLIVSDEQKKRLAMLEAAQRREAYVVLAIARAIGVEAFLGITTFDWPKILIVSTTRFDKITGNYIKAENLKPTQGDEGLMSIVQGSDRVKFKVNLQLSEFGFALDSPRYDLIAFTGKISGHAMSVVQHDSKWYTCSNSKVMPVDVTKSMETMGKQGFVEYVDFGKNQHAVPEILVYQRKD